MAISIILAIIVTLITTGLIGIIVMADMMSDNPSASISPWATMIIGYGIAVLLVLSHFIHFTHLIW